MTTIRQHKLKYLAFIVISTLLMSCDSGEFHLGATAGGSQDINFARSQINQGIIPESQSITVEGIYSEHDLPLEKTNCEQTLCINGALGIAPDQNYVPSAWAQIGLSSNMDAQNFIRDPISIIATVDISGSMTGNPLNIAKTLLGSIATQLNNNDRFALVTYGSDVTTVLELLPGNDSIISETISSLSTIGSTNMEAGLTRAYAIANQARSISNNVRILLFTDLRPNVGANTPSEFERLVSTGAANQIGLSVFGLGLDLGTEFVQTMSAFRSGNAFSLTRITEVRGFMEDNWPWMVTPIAHSLNVSTTIPAGLRITNSYGFPNTGNPNRVELNVASVFLSQRKGALLIKLQGEDFNNSPVNLDISYRDNNNLLHSSSIELTYEGQALDGNGEFMPQLGIAKTVALTLFVEELKRSLTLFPPAPFQAIEVLEAAVQRLNIHAAKINDPELNNEAQFWPRLLELMNAQASQSTQTDTSI